MINIHYTGLIFIAGALLLLAESALILILKRREDRLGYLGLALLLAGYTLYVYSFIAQDYSLKPVYETSAPGLPLIIKIGSSWSGGGSSIVLFIALSSVTVLIFRLANRSPSSSTITLSNLLIAAGVALAMLLGGFEKLEFEASTGMGINPLLKSLWLLPHPFTVFAAYSLIAISATLALGGHESAALNTARIGWVFVTLGNVTGGYWAYTTLGWGGYWAWDPVETSTLIPWLFLTAYFHALPFSKPLAKAMLYGGASSVFLSMAVTRTGLSPLHGFAEARTIAVGILLVLVIFFASMAINEASRESGRVFEKIVASKSPLLIGLLASFTALALSSIIIYITLVLPVVVSAIGRDASNLTLSHDRFVGITYPVLYPLFLLGLASIPLCSLREKISLRMQLALVGAALLAGIALGFESYNGELVWAPRSSLWTNIMISLSLPLLALALASSLVSILLSLAEFTHRSLGLSLLHFSLSLLVLGLVLSGPFAYNQGYFSDFTTLKLGDEIRVGDIVIKFVGFEYQLISEPVDVYNAYRGILPHYIIAGYWTLLLISTGWIETWSKAYHGMKMLESYGLLEAGGSHSIEQQIVLEMANLTLTLRTDTPPEVVNLTADRVEIKTTMVSVKLDYGLENVNGTDLRYSLISVSIHGDAMIVLRGDSMSLTGEQVQEAIVTANFSIRVTDNLVLEVRKLTLTTPRVMRGDDYLVLAATNTSMDVEGVLSSPSINLHTPSLIIDESIYYYLRLSAERSETWSLLLRTGYAEILADESIIEVLAEKASSRARFIGIENISELSLGELASIAEAPPLPATLPEGVKLLLHFEVRRGDSVRRHVVEARFDINGEIQGIRGTVPRPLIVRDQLGDIYVEPYPPVHEKSIPIGRLFIYMPPAHGMMTQVPAWISIPEPQLFYFHEVFKTLDPVSKFGLAMTLTLLNMQLGSPMGLSQLPPEVMSEVSRWLDSMNQLRAWASILRSGDTIGFDPFFVRLFTLRLTLNILESMTPAVFRVVEAIEGFSIEESTLKTQGVIVRVKTVPLVNIVWLASAALILSEIYIALASLRRR